MVERIEVIRGPAAARYAVPVPQVGGIIITKRPTNDWHARCRSIPTSRKAAKRVTPGG